MLLSRIQAVIVLLAGDEAWRLRNLEVRVQISLIVEKKGLASCVSIRGKVEFQVCQVLARVVEACESCFVVYSGKMPVLLGLLSASSSLALV